MSGRLKMSRQQISEFLKDPEAIKTFERLLVIADAIRDGAVVGVNGVETPLPIGSGIIESGSNSNGSWIKYGDGTMECWKTINSCVSGGTSTTVTLPATFIYDGTYGVSNNSIGIGKSQVPSFGTGGYFDVWMQNNGYTLIYRSQFAQGAYIHVIGRWKV